MTYRNSCVLSIFALFAISGCANISHAETKQTLGFLAEKIATENDKTPANATAIGQAIASFSPNGIITQIENLQLNGPVIKQNFGQLHYSPRPGNCFTREFIRSEMKGTAFEEIPRTALDPLHNTMLNFVKKSDKGEVWLNIEYVNKDDFKCAYEVNFNVFKK